MRINHNHLTTKANKPLYSQATSDVPAKTYSVETKHGPVEILVDPGMWEKIKYRKFHTNNDGYIYVSIGADERKRFGKYACRKRKTTSLHWYVIATVTGRAPTDHIDHINSIRDNRFNSLRLVTNGMNAANGISKTGSMKPGTHPVKNRGGFFGTIKIDNTTCWLGTYPEKDVAWRAIQPAQHYRAYLHALRSSWMMARHLAVATNAQTITELAQVYVASWPSDSLARLAYDYFCEVGIYGTAELPAVPKEKLKSLCQLSAAGSTTAAVDAAQKLAFRSEHNAFVALMKLQLEQQLA